MFPILTVEEVELYEEALARAQAAVQSTANRMLKFDAEYRQAQLKAGGQPAAGEFFAPVGLFSSYFLIARCHGSLLFSVLKHRVICVQVSGIQSHQGVTAC